MNTKQTEALKLARDFISAEWGFGGTTDIEPSKIVRMLEEALAEQPAQQQELVAYMNQNGVIHPADYEWEGAGNILTPLYTSPPASKPWVGLTDEERREIGHPYFSSVNMSDVAYARAIEAKLREKNA